MPPRFLIVLAVAQGGLLVLCAGGLALWHRLALARDARRSVDLERGRRAMRLFLEHRLLAEETVLMLDQVGDWPLTTLVNELSAHRSGDEFLRLVALVRRTHWHASLPLRARSRFWWRRLRAARSLAVIAGPEHLGLVHDLLEDRCAAVRLEAAVALGRLPSPGLALALLERATGAPPVERSHLIEILAASDALALRLLMERLPEPADEAETRTLLDLASRLGYTSLQPYVVPHASSDSLEVRIAAANCMRHFPHPQTSNALRRLLRDPAWEVRARAAAALGAIGAVEAIGELLASLGDRDWWVRLRSAIALRLVGPRGIEELRGHFRFEDRFARDMAEYVLSLDDAALAEYVGGASIDFAAPAAELAS